MGERSMAAKFCLQSIIKVLLHAVNQQHATDGFTSLSKEVLLLIFYHP
jgi:hypothetical protein